MPRRARLQFDLERDAAVGINRRRLRPDPIDEDTLEIAVDIGRAQFTTRAVPMRLNASAADTGTRFDLKDISKIRAQRDFEIEPDAGQTEIGQIEIFVDALRHVAADHEGHRVLGYLAVLGANGRIYQMDQRAIVNRGRRGQLRPRYAVGEHRIIAQDAGIVVKHALRTAVCDRSVELGDHESLSVINREQRGANVDLDGHGTMMSDSEVALPNASKNDSGVRSRGPHCGQARLIPPSTMMI